MSQPPKATTRKVVTLPKEVVDRVEKYRQSRNLASESDALRRLIETGLGLLDTPDELTTRCQSATLRGETIGSVISNILDDHPLVNEITITSDHVRIELRTGDVIQFQKNSQDWYLNEKEHIPF